MPNAEKVKWFSFLYIFFTLNIELFFGFILKYLNLYVIMLSWEIW